jgi:hypothetical protein
MVATHKISENRRSMYKAAIIVLSVIICLILLEKFTPVFTYGTIEVLTKLKTHPEIQKYENYSIEIAVLTKGDLADLSAKQPVVYAGLIPGFYQITFFSSTDKLLVIYDYQNDKIVRMFQINYL